MKTIKKLSFVVALSVAFVSCDLLEIPVNDVKFETETNLSVTQGSSGVAGLKVVALAKAFNKEGELKLADFPEIQDKLDKVSKMEITEVMVSAKNFVPSGTTISGFALSFPDLGITKNDFQGTEEAFNDIIVDFTVEELTKIQDAILKDKKIKYKVSGNVSNYPVTFTIVTAYTADLKVKLF
jgi:hypothetical protein